MSSDKWFWISILQLIKITVRKKISLLPTSLRLGSYEDKACRFYVPAPYWKESNSGYSMLIYSWLNPGYLSLKQGSWFDFPFPVKMCPHYQLENGPNEAVSQPFSLAIIRVPKKNLLAPWWKRSSRNRRRFTFPAVSLVFHIHQKDGSYRGLRSISKGAIPSQIQ